MYKKFVDILNDIFMMVCLFFAIYLWVLYFTKSVIKSLVVALIVSIALAIVIKMIISSKNKRKNISIKEEKQAHLYALSLMLSSKKDVLNLFKNAFNRDNSAQIKGGKIYVHSDQPFVFVPIFTKSCVDESDILEIINSSNIKVVIAAKEFSLSAKEIVNMSLKDVELMDMFKVYNLLKSLNITLDTSNIKPATKINYLRLIFNKNQSKPYFLAGLVVILSSFVVKYNIYYVIFGSLLFFVSLYARFNKKFN